VKIIIGTRKVGRRLSGSLVIALIDSGFDIANLAAVATTNIISMKPNKFQRRRIFQPTAPLTGEKIDTKRAVTATAMSPQPPGTAKV
jgi:hypothetical protein